MDLFAPVNLPGVGMGDLQSVAAILGLVGLAVTSGMLVAEGMIGTVAFLACAAVLLQQKAGFGGAEAATAAVFVFLLAAATLRLLQQRRASADERLLVGAAADDPQTRARHAGVERHRRRERLLAAAAVATAGAAAGFAWAEWNEVPFRLQDAEAAAGLAIGLVAAAVGGDAAWRFLQGAVRAGGHPALVGTVVVIVALLLNVVSVYVPFTGAAVLLVALVLAIRLRRRAKAKYAGLRILS